jgi:hypothetical protein
MEFPLSRPLEVFCYEVLAEVSQAEKRQEIQAVLLLAQENHGRVTPELVCNKLLGGRPLVVGKTILQRCRALQLFEGNDEESILTEQGLQSVSDGEVFIPEKGKYRIWVTNDPLFTRPMLDLEPVQENGLTRDQVQESLQRRRVAPAPGEGELKISRKVMADEAAWLKGQIFRPSRPGAPRYRINFVGPEWVEVPDEGARQPTRITWAVSDTESHPVHVDGAFQTHDIEPPGFRFDEIWLGILGERAQDWKPTEKGTCLHVGFKEITDAERASFRWDMTFERPKIPDLGEFDPTEAGAVPVAPRSQKDADQWATWLLGHRVNSYIGMDGFAELQAEVRREFPGFDVDLPGRHDLVRALRRGFGNGSDDRPVVGYWFLQAPLDLTEIHTSETEDAEATYSPAGRRMGNRRYQVSVE